VRADQEDLITAHHDVAFADVGPPAADGLDLPAFEGDASLVALLDEIIVERFAVLDDGHVKF
jgi:hypothetical protein